MAFVFFLSFGNILYLFFSNCIYQLRFSKLSVFVCDLFEMFVIVIKLEMIKIPNEEGGMC